MQCHPSLRSFRWGWGEGTDDISDYSSAVFCLRFTSYKIKTRVIILRVVKWSDFFLCNPSREDKASYSNLTVTRCSRLPDGCGHLLATRNRAVVIKRCVTSEVLNQFIMAETTVPYKRSLKPGSNMPPMHLRHGHRYCVGYCSDMRTGSGRQHCSSQSLPPAFLRSCHKFNFAGMRAVELCDGLSCRRRMFSFVWEVSQAIPAATSQIHRRHMRTRLINACYFYHACLHCWERRWCVNVNRKKIH